MRTIKELEAFTREQLSVVTTKVAKLDARVERQTERIQQLERLARAQGPVANAIDALDGAYLATVERTKALGHRITAAVPRFRLIRTN